MTIKTVTLALALALGFSATAANAEDVTSTATAAVGASIEKLIDPAKWHDDAGHIEPGMTVSFNPAHPEAWTNFINPKMHSKMHMAFTNPAQYGQFFKPKFYVDMMNPATWMAWMNPKSYAVLLDTSTYTYWMQPGAYKHAIDLGHYKQLINIDAYAKLGTEAKTGAEELVATDGEYSLVNTDNLIKIMNPMTYANAMIDGAKAIVQ